MPPSPAAHGNACGCGNRNDGSRSVFGFDHHYAVGRELQNEANFHLD